MNVRDIDLYSRKPSSAPCACRASARGRFAGMACCSGVLPATSTAVGRRRSSHTHGMHLARRVVGRSRVPLPLGNHQDPAGGLARLTRWRRNRDGGLERADYRVIHQRQVNALPALDPAALLLPVACQGARMRGCELPPARRRGPQRDHIRQILGFRTMWAVTAHIRACELPRVPGCTLPCRGGGRRKSWRSQDRGVTNEATC